MLQISFYSNSDTYHSSGTLKHFTWWRTLGKCKSKLCLKLHRPIDKNYVCVIKNITFLCYQHLNFLFFSEFFFNNDSFIFILLCFISTFQKKGPEVPIRVITNKRIDISFLITHGEKHEWTKVKTGKKNILQTSLGF